MINSIIIARSSADRHDVSCESQIQEIREEAIKRNENIYKTLTFSGTTHLEFNDDPEFKEILAEVKSKNRKWNKIWFYDTARVSRNRYKAQAIKTLLQHHDVIVEFLKFPKTGVDHVDNMMEGIMEAFDQMHSDMSRAGSIRGQKQNIRNGYRAGGKAPFGYRLKKHITGTNKENSEIFKTTLEPDPEKFPIANEYLVRRASGESRRSIFNDFESRCILNPSGNKNWSTSTGKSIEENVMVYQGHLTYNRHNSRIGKKRYIGGRKWKDEKEWSIAKNTHERCIDDDIANKIKRQLSKNKIRKNNPGPKRYLLTDILICGDCGSRMVGNSGFYSCQNKMRNPKNCSNSNIKAVYLDNEILRYLKEKLIKKEFYDEFVETIKIRYEEYKKQSQKDQKKHLKQIEKLKSRISKLMELYSIGKIDANLIDEQISPLQQELKDLKSKVVDFTELNNFLDENLDDFSNESIRHHLENFERMLTEDNMIEMRNLVRDFIVKITSGPKGQSKGQEKMEKARTP
jgi:site-specific DNA recombinase